MTKRFSIPALSIFLLFGFVFSAHAADSSNTEDRGGTNVSHAEDSISARDRDTYSRGEYAGRFGVSFHAHTPVCTTAASGEAHCDSRIIADRGGVTPAVIPAGLGPVQFLKAYGLTGQAAPGKPPIIAIVDAYDHPNIQKDLDTYSTTYGIPKLPACVGAVASSNTPCFQKLSQTGTTRYPSTNAGWALEIALDVEAAHATCQNCSILLIEANSATYTNLMAAVDRAVVLGANVVSNSYGAPEFSGETAYDSHFNHPGVAFTVSAGDSGYGVEYPAASPFVTSVGGTSLFLNADGSYNTETAWSGTGSGCSLYEQKQIWQTDPNCLKRTVADVSAVADPNTGAAVYDSIRYGGRSGWFQVGGTSLSSPIIAAIYALSGNIPAHTQETSLPYNALLALHDVFSGSNGVCGGLYLCTSLVGYDGPTGLGSPKGSGAF